jgi:Tfp pilus assembly protein PilV
MISLLALLNRCEGSTFNELLVSMGLITVAVLGYSLSSINVMRHQSVGDHSTVAIHLAQDKLEALQALKAPAEIDLCPSGGERGLSAKSGVAGIFDRCWKIAQSSFDSRLQQIDVTVSWRDYDTRQVTLSTLVYTGAE